MNLHSPLRTSSLTLALLLTLGLAACDDDQASPVGQTERDMQGDATDDQGMDQGDQDAGDMTQEPDLPPASSCGDGLCQEDMDDLTDCPWECQDAPVAILDQRLGDFVSFPDDFLTVDADTRTGLQVEVDLNSTIVQTSSPLFQKVFSDLNTLDGFGVAAGGFLRLSRPIDITTVPNREESLAPDSALFMGYLDDNGAVVRVPVDSMLTDQGQTIVLRPMFPLPPQTRAFFGITRQIKGEDGLAAEPGPIFSQIIGDNVPGDLQRIAARHNEVLNALASANLPSTLEDLAGLVVFTTQSTYSDSLEISENIKSLDYEVNQRLGCETSALWRRCTFTFMSPNYRNEEKVLVWNQDNKSPQGMYEIPVEVYLPLEATDLGSPYPITIFGHGLAGERTQARRLADFAAPLGMATISIDASEHGQHPDASGTERISRLLSFFGFYNNTELSGLALRDNWRQSAYDKLALVELLSRNEVDVDGDGEVDLDGSRLTYLGVSLGGIMGPELLALSDKIGAAVLVVAGARVTDVLQFSDLLSPVVSLLRPSGVTEGDIARFFPILQTIVDPGDPIAYAPYVLQDRLIEGDTPDVLMAMVLDDDTVPEPTNFALARALRVPHVPPVRRAVPLVEPSQEAPISQNMPSGATGGLIQLDLILKNDQWETATHNNVGDSNVGAETWLRFLDGWLRDGSAVIVDPYESLGLERPEP